MSKIERRVKEYQDRMQNGPIKEEDIIGHFHTVEAIQAFQDAFDELRRIFPYRNELDADLYHIVKRVLEGYKLPRPLLAEPVKRGPRRRPRSASEELREKWK